MNLCDQLDTVVDGLFAGDYLWSTAVNPASDGRSRDIKLWVELAVSRFANRFLNPVVIGPAGVRGLHRQRIGRVVGKG